MPQGESLEDRGDVRAPDGSETVQGRDAGVLQHPRQGLQRGLRGRGVPALSDRGRARGASLVGGLLEQQSAVGQRQLDVLAQRHLDGRVMPPAGDGVPPRLDLEMPQAFGGDRHLGPITVDARGQLAHDRERAAAGVGPAQRDARPEHVMSLTKNGGAYLERLARDRLGGTLPASHDWLHVDYRNPADHLRQATRTGRARTGRSALCFLL